MTTDERITTRRAALTKQRAERKDPDDLMLSPHARRAYTTETDRLDAKIAAIPTASAALAELGSVEPLTRWRDFVTKARDTLSAERLQIRSPIRDREVVRRAEDLEFGIKLIDKGFGIAKMGIVTLEPTRIGELMQAAGFAVAGAGLRGANGWGGALPEVEARIKDLTRRRAAAQAALDEALLTDEERTQKEAEGQAYRDALKAMTIRGGADGVSLVAYDEWDAPIDRATLSELQQKAIAWFEAAQRPRETVSS